MSELVKVRFTVEATIALVGSRAFSNGDEAEISKKEALSLAKAGKCEILQPERKIAARKKAPVTR